MILREKSLAKRILLFTLILSMILCVLSFTSCGRSYDEDEVKAATAKLLKDAEMLNDVYFGKGISYVTGAHQNGSYYEADFMHLKALGFTTIDELKAITERTYSDSYCKTIYSTKLGSVGSGYVRYYQKYENEVKKTGPICIMVYDDIDPQSDKVVYDYSSIEAVGSEGEYVNMTVKATVTNTEGKSQTVNLNIQLIEQENGWRINSPTHAIYNDFQELYDELLNNDIG